MKLSRKSSSSYSLKLDTSKRQSTKVRRKPLSTPTSPSRSSREPQCTCMTADQFNRLRAQDPRYNKERCLLFFYIFIYSLIKIIINVIIVFALQLRHYRVLTLDNSHLEMDLQKLIKLQCPKTRLNRPYPEAQIRETEKLPRPVEN